MRLALDWDSGWPGLMCRILSPPLGPCLSAFPFPIWCKGIWASPIVSPIQLPCQLIASFLSVPHFTLGGFFPAFYFGANVMFWEAG